MFWNKFRSPPIALPLLLLLAVASLASVVSTFVAQAAGTNVVVAANFSYSLFAIIATMLLLAGVSHCGGEMHDVLVGNLRRADIGIVLALGMAIALSAFGIELLVEYPMALVDPRLAIELYKLSPTALPHESPSIKIGYLSILFVYVAATPILEELVFRAYIFQRIAQKHGIAKGLLLSSLIFGMFHWPHVLSESFAGIIFCVIYIRFHSLAASILAHAASNLTITLGLSLTAFPFQKDVEHLGHLDNWRCEIASLGMGVFLIIFVARRCWPTIRTQQHSIGG